MLNREENLKKQNEKLKKQLSLAKNWMKREVEWKKLSIAKERQEYNQEQEIRKYYKDNAKEITISSIKAFLWDLVFSQTSDYVLENIISSEVFFYNQRYFKFTDGLWVITGYHKAFDYLIEENITKLFRIYSKKNKQIELKKNDLNEKNLHLVINKWYTIWLWRLYSILTEIKEGKHLGEYLSSFNNFLNEYLYIKEVLLDKDFFYLLWDLVDSELFWEKRHKWQITFEETKYARTLLIWDLKDKNCIIYSLIKIWIVEF